MIKGNERQKDNAAAIICFLKEIRILSHTIEPKGQGQRTKRLQR